MKITVNTIETERDYDLGLVEVGRLMEADPLPGTADFARLEVLGALVEAYEEEHYPIEPPDPIDAIRFRLDQQGMDESDLEGILGSRSRVWEIMHHKRPLTLEMIRRLNAELGVPAESLLAGG